MNGEAQRDYRVFYGWVTVARIIPLIYIYVYTCVCVYEYTQQTDKRTRYVDVAQNMGKARGEFGSRRQQRDTTEEILRRF